MRETNLCTHVDIAIEIDKDKHSFKPLQLSPQFPLVLLQLHLLVRIFDTPTNRKINSETYDIRQKEYNNL